MSPLLGDGCRTCGTKRCICMMWLQDSPAYLRNGENCCASCSSLHSGHHASMFHSRMPTMATLMLPSVMRRPAMMGEAMRHVRSILRMPAHIHPLHALLIILVQESQQAHSRC